MTSKLIRKFVAIFVVFLPVLFLLATNGVAAAGRNAIPSSSSAAATVTTTSLFSRLLPSLLSSIGIESNNSGSNTDDVSGTKIVLLPEVMAPVAETTTESSRQGEEEWIEVAVYSYFFLRGRSTRNSSSNNHLRQQTNSSNERSSGRMLKKHPSNLPFSFDFDPNWNYNDPHSWMQFLPFLVLLWVCWCILSCVCNCVRWCCCGRGGGRGQYHRIGPNQYAYHNNNNNADRPILNVLWAFCCFEYCCRDNQDIGGGDCCQLCAPLVCLECCCP